jgi:substrate import-associated zinc metallohydrolase lipoprotein
MKTMKTININLVAFLVTVVFLGSCKKDDFNAADANNINGLGGDTWVKGPIDKWIFDTLTTPYNISVKYKWDQFESLDNITKTLVPPKEENVIPILSAVKKVWIDPYIATAGESFFKKITPKFMYLLGSYAYNSDGSVTGGSAEGGVKILLLNVNGAKTKGMAGYSIDDSCLIKEMLHVIHHEFAHILHQNILYPVDFKNLNPSLITSNWGDYGTGSICSSDVDAWKDGFASAYAMNVSDDDFVETVSIMLVNGKEGWESLIASVPPGVSNRGTTQAQAIARLRAKESIVVNYYKQAWGIDFYTLQARVRAAVKSLIY